MNILCLCLSVVFSCFINLFHTYIHAACIASSVGDLHNSLRVFSLPSLSFSTFRPSSYTRFENHSFQHVPFQPNPYLHVSFLSKLTFNWANDLVMKGWKKDPLPTEDLYEVPIRCASAYVGPLILKSWILWPFLNKRPLECWSFRQRMFWSSTNYFSCWRGASRFQWPARQYFHLSR